MASIALNEGAQYDFVLNSSRHSAFMGGRGAGKTLASVVRGLNFAQQPKVPGQLPPVGCLLAVSFPHLRDIVYPAMYLVMEMLGMRENKDWKEVKNQADRKFVLLQNGAEIKMRSLDEPNKVRGLNLSWFGIDEGRMFSSDEAYKILLACLRQGTHPDKETDAAGIWVPGENYKHAGWVTSTPIGYDWMWRRFHPQSPNVKPNTVWYNAPTYTNKKHLPAAFIQDLEADYEVGSNFYRQEVLGEFVGAVHGAVWPMFDMDVHVQKLAHDPRLELLAGWDFGIADASVCLFAQRAYVEKILPDKSKVAVPTLKIIGAIEDSGLTVAEFARNFFRYCDKHFGGRVPSVQWGDPNGMARNQVSGTSTIAEFNEQGVYIRPAPKRPIDEGIIIAGNLMDRPDGFAIDEELHEVQKAVQTYRFKVDDLGTKLSKEPIHDWTSHACSALRYLAIGSIGLQSRRSAAPTEVYERGTMGNILRQVLDQDKDDWVMNQEERSPLDDWHPDKAVGLEGLFD